MVVPFRHNTTGGWAEPNANGLRRAVTLKNAKRASKEFGSVEVSRAVELELLRFGSRDAIDLERAKRVVITRPTDEIERVLVPDESVGMDVVMRDRLCRPQRLIRDHRQSVVLDRPHQLVDQFP